MFEKELIKDNNYRIKIIILMLIISILITFIVMSIIASPKYLLNPLKERPWNESNLKIFIDTTGVPDNETQIYYYNALFAFRWWESNEGKERLGYQVNFMQVHNQEDANIIIKWTDKLYNNDEILGHTYINTSPSDILGFQLTKGESGDQSCDANNPPFTLCKITIKLGLSDIEMQRVISHEIGHAFGLQHSFNTNDFIVFWLFSNYVNSPTDIMFDTTVVVSTIIFYLIVVIVIFYIIFCLIYPRLNKNVE